MEPGWELEMEQEKKKRFKNPIFKGLLVIYVDATSYKRKKNSLVIKAAYWN